MAVEYTRVTVVILSVLLISWGTFANFNFAYAADTPPTVSIAAPTDGSSFVDGTSITFTGSATDVEDGVLTSSLSWSSDIDGVFGGVSVPIAVDNVTPFSGVCSPCSFVHNVGVSGSDKIIIVGISPKWSATITGVTYGGLPLTEIRTDQDAGVTRSSLWYKVNPPTGANTVDVTLSVPEEVAIGAISFNNVDQTDPIGNHNGATGKSTSPLVKVVTTVDDSWIVDITGTLDGPMNAVGGQTEQWDVNIGSTRGAGGTEVTTTPVQRVVYKCC